MWPLAARHTGRHYCGLISRTQLCHWSLSTLCSTKGAVGTGSLQEGPGAHTLIVKLSVGFPDASDRKESTCNAGDPGSIPGSERFSGEGNGNPFQYSWLENSKDRGDWWVYSPWGCKELHMTERLTFSLFILLIEESFLII